MCSKTELEDPEKKHSSILVTVEKEADAKQLLQKKAIFMLGKYCKITEHMEKPRTKQCNNCQEFGHLGDRCGKVASCAHCAQDHHTSEHECEKCEVMAADEGEVVCMHTPAKCVNCKGKHRADSRACPARLRYEGRSLPSTTQRSAWNKQNGSNAVLEEDGFQIVTKKKHANLDQPSIRQQQIEHITAVNERIHKIRRGFRVYNIKGTGIKDGDIRSLMDQFPEDIDIWLQLRTKESQKGKENPT
jgi:hypothetical protein